jgi:hypothetical protein
MHGDWNGNNWIIVKEMEWTREKLNEMKFESENSSTCMGSEWIKKKIIRLRKCRWKRYENNWLSRQIDHDIDQFTRLYEPVMAFPIVINWGSFLTNLL